MTSRWPVPALECDSFFPQVMGKSQIQDRARFGYPYIVSPNAATPKCKIRRSGVLPTRQFSPLKLGVIFAPQGASVMSGGIFDGHGWGVWY